MPPLSSTTRSGLGRPVPAAERAGPALAALALLGLAAILAGCGSAPRVGRDGPPPGPPPEASRLPDAEPRIEPLRTGGPNKPYEVLGRSYVPQTRDLPMNETGIASWYGQKFHGRRTANGEVFDMHAMTAAHKTMPLPSYARVRNPANGREVVVRVNDRGPFVDGRIIDLSYAAAVKLGVAGGIAPVVVERLTFEDIRTGAWRRGGSGPPAPDPAVEPAPVVVAAARAPAAPTAPDVTAATVAATRMPSTRTAPAPSPTSAATTAPHTANTPAGPPSPPPAVAAAPAATLLSAAPVPASPPPVAAPPKAREAATEPLPESGLALAIALMGDGAGGAAGGRSLGGSAADPRPAPASRSGPSSTGAAPATPRAPGVPAASVAPPAVTGAAAIPRGFWIQLGAFREREGVESFQQRIAGDLDWLAPRLTVFDEAPLLRLQAGPYASRDEAQLAAQQVREALQLVPLVIERR